MIIKKTIIEGRKFTRNLMRIISRTIVDDYTLKILELLIFDRLETLL
uniref:Uncharacterized protein n=1 Tax=Lactococcus lactis subsp. lactis bv. diacetylactis TaxID=44688 RepID=A0A2R4AKT4_LACLL|nr:hypothetical protein pLd10_40 [Lactococcus lactis subsp. lactis bv. diacetylactis]